MGWTINFAHPWAWPTSWLSLPIAVGPVLTMLVLALMSGFLATRGR